MQTKIINPNHIKANQIEETVTRVKAFIFNGEYIFLDKIDWGYMLPGGHVEDGEDFDLALLREVEEETGIVLDDADKITKFYQTEKYRVNERTGKNRLNRIVYYMVLTTKTPNINGINLTDNEREHDLKVIKVHIDEFENTLNEAIKAGVNESFVVIAKEMLDAYNILKQETIKTTLKD